MGIRFICPVCEKRIHVKSFLAGKRGICPKCGGKVDIPSESDSSGSDRRESGPPVPPGGYATASMPYAPQVATANPVASAAPVSPASVASATIPGGMSAVPVAGTAQPANGQVQPVHRVGPVAIAQPTAQPSPQQVDPLAEAPQAKWYVRPPSGGQFGPAASDVMRRWLGEGRVSPDSLVWREGWADWKKTSTVFPELAPAEPAPATPAPPEPTSEFPSAAPKSSGGRTYARRKSSSGLAVAMVVTLAVVAIGLLAGLMWVLNRA